MQLALFPSFVCFGDELVLDWTSAREVFEAASEQTFSPEQSVILRELDHLIESNSGKKDEDLFVTAEALHVDPRWAQIRMSAKSFIASMNWPLLKPWMSNSVYIKAA